MAKSFKDYEQEGWSKKAGARRLLNMSVLRYRSRAKPSNQSFHPLVN
jgi:hypothetical protein